MQCRPALRLPYLLSNAHKEHSRSTFLWLGVWLGVHRPQPAGSVCIACIEKQHTQNQWRTGTRLALSEPPPCLFHQYLVSNERRYRVHDTAVCRCLWPLCWQSLAFGTILLASVPTIDPLYGPSFQRAFFLSRFFCFQRSSTIWTIFLFAFSPLILSVFFFPFDD